MLQKPYLVGLTGGSGSGKTTFLRHVEQAFSDQELLIISQDNYYRPRHEQHTDENGIQNFDLPHSINHEEFVRDVQTLMQGDTVHRLEYTFNNPNVKPKELVFEPRPIIILEGIFVMYEPIVSDLLDLKVFLYAPETTAFSRRIRRDQIERNYPLEDVLYRYEKHVLPTYEKYIKPLHQKADIVINNHTDFDKGLDVFIGFLKTKVQRP